MLDDHFKGYQCLDIINALQPVPVGLLLSWIASSLVEAAIAGMIVATMYTHGGAVGAK